MDKSKAEADRDKLESRINSLIYELTCDDVIRCQKARKELVSIGKPAVNALIDTLKDSREQVRWEGVKALGQIADPSATPALLEAMEDKDFDIRWLAAEGMIAIGKKVLVPLMNRLIERFDSVWFRNGAHHVLHNLARKDLYNQLRPVLIALEDPLVYIEVPSAAETTLSKLKK